MNNNDFAAAEKCTLCAEPVTYCTCWRCMTCGELFTENAPVNFDQDGELTCRSCIGSQMGDTCECGAPATAIIDNGKHLVEVCEECWKEPENIAVEVCVDVASFICSQKLEFSQFSNLDVSALMIFNGSLNSALKARNISDGDSAISHTVARCWNEWYAPVPS